MSRGVSRTVLNESVQAIVCATRQSLCKKNDAICHILDEYIYASPFELYDSCLFDAAT